MKSVALIDSNNFYVSCERLFAPHLAGRPVIVLSNNDGVVVSRSQEAKDLGIPMAVPVYQVEDKIRRHKIAVYSSNYALYADMSARVHDAIGYFADEMEIYSIDEAFVTIEANRYLKSPFDYGVEIRSSIRQWTGIPTSIGIAPTKTLAKIAGDIAKRSPDGVFDLTDATLTEKVLGQTDLIDIWGVNHATANKLRKLGINSALQLRDMDIRTARKRVTVVGARLIEELRGTSSLKLEMITPMRKTICCSRSFSSEVRSLTEMSESVINHLSTAAEKMRRQHLVTNAVQLLIETNRFREKGRYTNTSTVKVTPTDSTRELIDQTLRLLRSAYKPGYGYRKSGVTLLGLQPRSAETQRLFNEYMYLKGRGLMKTVDGLNQKHGRNAVRFGMPIKRETAWHMMRSHLSPGYTTDIDHILRVSG